MKLQGAIFDFDGTLFDSMYVWDTAGADYLRGLGWSRSRTSAGRSRP
jgi:beta-phosphoglucomutase-like phosphatase (HAD superfamily)